MLSLPLMLLLAAFGLAFVVKLVIPLCEKHEREIYVQQLAAVKAVSVLKNKVKPGVYTFRWAKGKMLEPVYEKHEGRKVVMRFAHDDRVTEKLQEMPSEFQCQLLQLIRSGMTPKRS